MLKNALRDLVNWQTKGQSSDTKSSVLARKITISRRKTGNSQSIFQSLLTYCLLARSVTTGTQGCDRRLAKLISYFHHTSDYRQHCHVSNTAQHCRMGLFQDSDLARDVEDSKSTSGRSYVFLEAEQLSPLVACARSKRQYPTVLQHQKSLRWMLDCEWMDYLRFTYGMWSLKFYIQRTTPNHKPNRQRETVGAKRHPNPNRHRETAAMQETEALINCQRWVTSPRTQILLKESLNCFSVKKNEAFIKMILKCRSPTM